MDEQLAWAKWWACPWALSHSDWRLVNEEAGSLSPIYQSHHQALNKARGIGPRLPTQPHSSIIRLALASPTQMDLMLALAASLYQLEHDSSVNVDDLLWCERFSKALQPDASLLLGNDSLSLLYNWLEPDVWVRLRLRFARTRVLVCEQHTRALDPQKRLDTLWHAIIWRVTSCAVDEPSDERDEDIDHVVSTQA